MDEKAHMIRVNAALYRIEAGMNLVEDDPTIVALAYRLLQQELSELKGARTRALIPIRNILGAVDGVLAEWASGEGGAELVPTTVGQWAEQAIRELQP